MRIIPTRVPQFVTKGGNIERSVISTGWIRPATVEISGEELLFDYREPFQRVRAATGMMQGFLRLESTSNERILAFARRWGALRISPVDEDSGEFMKPQAGSFSQILYGPNESLSEWRAAVREFRDVLTLAAQLEEASERRAMTNHVREQKSRVSDLSKEVQVRINGLLFANMVRPHIGWTGERWTIRLHIRNLGGALAVQTMLMVARKDGLALCGSCGETFETDGKRKVYCQDCGLKAAQRAASRKRYKAVVAARAMSQQGKTAAEIAAVLGRPVGKIRRWVGNSVGV
jgi:DNA-directed RNA polymerase subunit RPC12/RpoP